MVDEPPLIVLCFQFLIADFRSKQKHAGKGINSGAKAFRRFSNCFSDHSRRILPSLHLFFGASVLELLPFFSRELHSQGYGSEP